jgi:superfamily II RNA helicase
MNDARFFVRPVAIWPAATVYAWAMQKSWQDALFVAGIAEGDLAMLIVRTADNLRQLRNLEPWFPEVARCAGRAVDALIRGPLLAGDAILEAGLGE